VEVKLYKLIIIIISWNVIFPLSIYIRSPVRILNSKHRRSLVPVQASVNYLEEDYIQKMKLRSCVHFDFARIAEDGKRLLREIFSKVVSNGNNDFRSTIACQSKVLPKLAQPPFAILESSNIQNESRASSGITTTRKPTSKGKIPSSLFRESKISNLQVPIRGHH
jgi:hypothetical protein